MAIIAIWWAGVFLEVLILVRGTRAALFSKYPGFYFYLASVAVVELSRLIAFRQFPNVYPLVYWNTQFVSLVVGCVVIFEVYRTGLKEFPGTARMARNLLALVFAFVFSKAVLTAADGTSWLAALTAMKLERDLRLVQAGALLALVVAFAVYKIPLSTNLKGILLGYGLFVSMSVVQLTVMVRSGVVFQGIWKNLRPIGYLLMLCLWVVALWSYQEAPRPAHTITLDEDYKMLVASTRKRFQKTRLALGKAVRP
jgi:hypothetical protein